MIHSKLLSVLTLLSVVILFSTNIAISQERLPSENPTTVKLGVILPLSGEAASVGEAVKNGISIGLQKLPADIRSKIELIYEDDRLAPLNTISAFHRLDSVQKVDIILNVSSGTANALAPISEQNKIPLIAIATDPAVVKGRKYAVNFWVTPEEEARVMVPEVLKRGYKNIARIITVQDFAISLKSHFETAPLSLKPAYRVYTL